MRSGPGLSVVAVGVIEAVDVRDGHFTPVLRGDEHPGLIALEFADRMKERVMQNLCRRVVVEGRLCAGDGNGYRLDVRCLQAVRPGADPGDPATTALARSAPAAAG